MNTQHLITPATHQRHRPGSSLLAHVDPRWAGDPSSLTDPQAVLRRRISQVLAGA